MVETIVPARMAAPTYSILGVKTKKRKTTNPTPVRVLHTITTFCKSKRFQPKHDAPEDANNARQVEGKVAGSGRGNHRDRTCCCCIHQKPQSHAVAEFTWWLCFGPGYQPARHFQSLRVPNDKRAGSADSNGARKAR